MSFPLVLHEGPGIGQSSHGSARLRAPGFHVHSCPVVLAYPLGRPGSRSMSISRGARGRRLGGRPSAPTHTLHHGRQPHHPGMTDYVALGLYLDMLSHPSGWRINIRQLAKTHKQGRQVLTDAMNDLIARGLVFRVRFQEASGRWRTRTYVCSTPVTLDELGKSNASTTTVRHSRPAPELTDALAAGRAHTRHCSERPTTSTSLSQPATQTTSHLVTPSTRFPAPGGPAAGAPDTGQPACPRHGTSKTRK